MRRFAWAAAVAGAAAVLLSGLWMEPADAGVSAGRPPTIAGKTPLAVAEHSCPPRGSPRCAKGYRAECIRWVYGGPTKGPNMVKCCGRMGCVPDLSNRRTKEPFKGSKPLPWSRFR
jgi:hypothetical protein